MSSIGRNGVSPDEIRQIFRESSTDDLRTSGTVGHGRVHPRKRHGVPMRTPSPGRAHRHDDESC